MPPEEPFGCEVTPERDAVRVRPEGELDMDTVLSLMRRCASYGTADFAG